MLQPTPREKYIAECRQLALQHGLYVQLPKKDEVLWVADLASEGLFGLVRYFLPLDGDDIIEDHLGKWMGIHTPQDNSWFDRTGSSSDKELKECLDQLLVDSIANNTMPQDGQTDSSFRPAGVEINRQYLAVYWREQSKDYIPVIGEVLGDIKSRLSQ